MCFTHFDCIQTFFWKSFCLSALYPSFKVVIVTVHTGYKLVCQLSPPAETVYHIWHPSRLSTIFCFLPRLLCLIHGTCRVCLRDSASFSRKHNHAGSLGGKPFFEDSSRGRKQDRHPQQKPDMMDSLSRK